MFQAVANNLDNNISVLLGNGNGTFAGAVNYNVGTGPYGITTGGFDGDGDLETGVRCQRTTSFNFSQQASINSFCAQTPFHPCQRISPGISPEADAKGHNDTDSMPEVVWALYAADPFRHLEICQGRCSF
jgi:hypothetical protein